MPESSVNHHQFDNGLVLVAETMPSVQSAAFTLLIPAGAAHEPADRGGSASMLAEWITRGAGDLDSRELLTALDNLGVSHGEGAQTLYSSVSAATLGRNLIPALEIYADVLQRPHLDDEEMEPLRSQALQSLHGLEDAPDSKVILELRKRHFPDPWGRSSTGSIEGVKNATPDDLRAFHQSHYRPNGAILAAAGAIDFARLKEAVARLFGDWQPRPESAIQVKPGGPSREHLLKETQQTQIALAYPAVTLESPDYYQSLAMINILGGYSSSRLFAEVREKRGLCYSVGSSYDNRKFTAAVICYVGTSPDRAQESLDVTLEEITRIHRDGIEAEELDTMRAGLKSSLIMQQESSMSRTGMLASDWFNRGRVRSVEEIAGALDALTPESVSDFARRSTTDGMTIVTLGPSALKLPEVG